MKHIFRPAAGCVRRKSGTSIVVTGLFQDGMELAAFASLDGPDPSSVVSKKERMKRDNEERAAPFMSVFMHPVLSEELSKKNHLEDRDVCRPWRRNNVRSSSELGQDARLALTPQHRPVCGGQARPAARPQQGNGPPLSLQHIYRRQKSPSSAKDRII